MKVTKILKNKMLSLFMGVIIAFTAFLPIALAPVTVSAADQINLNTSYHSSSFSQVPAGSRQYSFILTSPGSINIQFQYYTQSQENFSAAWFISLYNYSTGQSYNLPKSYFSASSIPEESGKIDLPVGNYYISITDTTANTASPAYLTSWYSFSVSFTPENTYATPATARNTDINELNRGITGKTTHVNDIKFYKFNLPNPGSLTLNFSIPSSMSDGNWDIQLYDINVEISTNAMPLQYERVGFDGVISGGRRTNTLYKIRLPAGTYYIRIAPYNTSVSSSTLTAEYTLSATYTAETTNRFEKEPNDSTQTATQLFINSPVTGNLNTAADRDYFMFNVSGSEEIKIQLETSNSTNQNIWAIDLLTERGGIQTYSAGQTGVVISGKRIFISDAIPLQTGRYYVVVYYALNSYSFSNSKEANEDYVLTVSSATSPSTPEREDDKNYTTPIPSQTSGVNERKQGEIKSVSDENRFPFAMNQKGAVRLRFETPSNIQRDAWEARLYDTNNNLLLTERFGSGGEISGLVRTKMSNKIRLPAGSYYVQIKSVSSATLSPETYNLTVLYDRESAEYKSGINNSPSRANNIRAGVNEYMIGNLSDHSDIDYYKTEIESNGRFTVNFTSTRNVVQDNWTLKIYKSDAKTVLYEGRFGADGTQNLDDIMLKTKKSNKLRLPKGIYYISVQAFSQINFSNEDYKISIDYVAESAEQYKQAFNNTPETANALKFNTDLTGNLSNNTEIDYYKVTADNTNTIQIRFSVNKDVTPNAYWRVKVFDAQLKELKSFRIGGDFGTLNATTGLRSVKTEVISVSPGAYYITVEPASKDDFSNDDYILKVLDANGQRLDSAVSAPYTYTADVPSNWAKEEVERAYAYGLVPQSYMRNFKDHITRAEFCTLTMQFLMAYENKTIAEILVSRQVTQDVTAFSDTQDPVILAAYALGIIKGRGNRIFDPAGKITREEAAIMLMRLGLLVGINSNTMPMDFNDKNKFQPEAINAVGYVSACVDNNNTRVMQGDQGNFMPHDNYTREQSYLTMIRLYFVK